jgi:glutamate synthase (NADPH/NADH) large chain
MAFVVDVAGRRGHDIVAKGLAALRRLDHRGARGAEPDTGDGAGVLIGVPDEFLRAVVGFALPAAGHYATGLVFLPTQDEAALRAAGVLERHARAEGAEVLGWREPTIDPRGIGASARASLPRIRQVFLAARRPTSGPAGPAGPVGPVGPAGEPLGGVELDRVMFCVRKRAEREARERGLALHLPSLSSRTIVYKGMLTPEQVGTFYRDLSDERVTSAVALVHSRFSTNTFPSWPLAHPYRYIAHNGEINTIRGNRNWMAAREALLDLAGVLRPPALRTLDVIHLATAIELGTELAGFVAYDARLLTAAHQASISTLTPV